jgi:hypothetical protein
MIITEKLDRFPAGNPFDHDLYHMGTSVGNNILVMMSVHSTQRAKYLIICNKETGERLMVRFDKST